MKRLLTLIIAIFSFASLFAKDPIIIGIAGGTGSGKTTLANRIQEAFPGQSIVISQDSYYKDLGQYPMEVRVQTNFDHPDSIDFDLLVAQLKELKSGRSIQKPVYSFREYTREKYSENIAPNKIIIVEGILLFAVPEVREMFDLKLFVDTDDHVRLFRRIKRDINERGRTLESVCDQYLATVKPMHKTYVQPSKKEADLIVPHGGENPWALGLIKSKLREEISQ